MSLGKPILLRLLDIGGGDSVLIKCDIMNELTTIQLPITKEEKELLKARALKSGMKVRPYIRYLLFNEVSSKIELTNEQLMEIKSLRNVGKLSYGNITKYFSKKYFVIKRSRIYYLINKK